MSAKTTKVTLLATTVLLSALYQSHTFANELPTEPNSIVEVSDAQAEVVGEVTSSEVVTNSSNAEESNGESFSEITSTEPVVSDDITNSEIVTNTNTSDSNGNVVNEQVDSALSSNNAPVVSDSGSASVGGVNAVEIVNSKPIANVLPAVQAASNAPVVTNSVNSSSGSSAIASTAQSGSSDASESKATDVLSEIGSGETISNLSEEATSVAVVKEDGSTVPRSVIAKAPVQAASGIGLSSISDVVSSKSTTGQKLFFALILTLMFAFGFSTYNKKKKNELSYL